MRYDYRHTETYLAQKKDKPFLKPRIKTKKDEVEKQTIFPIEKMEGRKGLVARECPTCGKMFATYKCLAENVNKTYCSRDCYTGQSTVKAYANAVPDSKSKTSYVKRILKQAGFYKERQDQYKDKIIQYPESPTGKGYIGVAKRPLMPAVGNGHGFQGVLMQDETREFIQCHSCGKWLQKISQAHLRICCDLPSREYKARYGLNLSQGLVSDETSLRLTANCLKNTRPFDITTRATGKGHRGSKMSTEFQNKYGTCPLQIKERLYQFIRDNRELPGPGNRGKMIYKCLKNRFGTWGDALVAHGLPHLHRRGTNMSYEFADGTKYEYNMNRNPDREMLYQLLLQKCPFLTQ